MYQNGSDRPPQVHKNGVPANRFLHTASGNAFTLKGGVGVSIMPTITPAAVLTQASAVPAQFGSLIVLVAALSIGFGVVGYVIAKLRSSTY